MRIFLATASIIPGGGQSEVDLEQSLRGSMASTESDQRSLAGLTRDIDRATQQKREMGHGRTTACVRRIELVHSDDLETP